MSRLLISYFLACLLSLCPLGLLAQDSDASKDEFDITDILDSDYQYDSSTTADEDPVLGGSETIPDPSDFQPGTAETNPLTGQQEQVVEPSTLIDNEIAPVEVLQTDETEFINAEAQDNNLSPEPDITTSPPAQKPVIIEVPVQPVMGKEERIRSIIILVAAIILIFALLAIIILLIKRGKEIKAAAAGHSVDAFLLDTRGYTSHTNFQLAGRPTMIGRVAGKDTEHLNYFVIPESTIGRRHALIDYKDYAYWISDQGSINGTFVNNKPVNSEIRLKHGDVVRFHKFEFDFSIPELDDAGMTVVSSTEQQALEPINNLDELEAIKDVLNTDSAAAVDFDIGAGSVESVDQITPDTQESPGSDDETFIKNKDEEGADDQDIESDDETLMPGSFTGDEHGETEDDDVNGLIPDDETLMPGASFDDTSEKIDEVESSDETILPGSGFSDEDESSDETLIPTGQVDEKREKKDEQDADAFENFFDLDGYDDEVKDK